MTALTKSGMGTLILTNPNNTYTGKTFLNDGITQIAADGSLGTASNSAVADSITFGGGTLLFANSTVLNANRGITLNARGGTLDTGTNTVTYGGSVRGIGG